MKNNTTAIIAEKKATAYFCLLNPLQAKKVLFAMNRITGDQCLSDSALPEVRHIAKMYDGFVLQSKAAKELAAKLAKAYDEKYPRTLLTKKSVAQYTDARYRKLIEAVGEYGFDYVLEALRQGKAYVANPANNIDEKQLLRAMRWVERNPTKDADASNFYHRKKGLAFLGLDEELVEYSFIIASVYELVQPATGVQFGGCEANEPVSNTADEATVEAKSVQTVREMKIHLIEKAGLLEDFYVTPVPVVPDGYSEEELAPDSVIVGLAIKGRLKDSDEVLKYIDLRDRYAGIMERLRREFCDAELDVILGESEKVKALIANAW